MPHIDLSSNNDDNQMTRKRLGRENTLYKLHTQKTFSLTFSLQFILVFSSI